MRCLYRRPQSQLPMTQSLTFLHVFNFLSNASRCLGVRGSMLKEDLYRFTPGAKYSEVQQSADDILSLRNTSICPTRALRNGQGLELPV